MKQMNNLTIKTAALAVLRIMVASTAWSGEAPEFTPPDQLAIEKIVCEGNTQTTCETIQEEVRINPGSKVDEEQISDARIRLGLTGLFKENSLSLEKGSEPGKVILKIQVQEESPYLADLQTGVVLDTGGPKTGLNARFGYKNLFGKGKILNGIVQGYKRFDSENSLTASSAQLEYIDPHFLGSRRFYLTAGLEYASLTRPAATWAWSETTQSLSQRDPGTTETGHILLPKVGLGYRLGEFSYLHLGYGYGFPNGIWKEMNQGVSVTYGWNSLDDVAFPTRGSVLLLNVGGLIGNTSSSIGYGQAGYRTYWSAGPKSTLNFTFLGGTPDLSNFSSGTSIVSNVGYFNNRPALGLGYGYDLKQGAATTNSNGISRARFTVDAGFKSLGIYSSMDGWFGRASPAVRAGLTLDVPAFGTIDLFLMAQKDNPFGSR